MIDEHRIVEYLEKLDLSEIEANFYLTLLKSGPLSVRDLALMSGVKRTTSYLYIEQLIDRGMVKKIIAGSKKQVEACEPSDCLKSLIDEKIDSAQKAQSDFPELVKIMNSSIAAKSSLEHAEITYSKGLSNITKIYMDAMKSRELSLYVTLSEIYSLFPEDFFEQGLKRNPKLEIFEIYGDLPKDIKKFNFKASNPRYHYKFMPEGVGLASPGILHYDNKVAIINTRETPNAVVLSNRDFYINSKKIFDFIWRTLPQPEI